MVLDTALCFMLSGVALALPSTTGYSRATSAISGIVAAIATAVLVERLLKADLGIDLRSLHAWFDNFASNPGRMSAPVASAFLMGSGVTMFANHVRRPWVAKAAPTLILGVGSIGMLGIAGYMVNAPLLFPEYLFAGMAMHTSVGLVILAFGLHFYWKRFELGKNPLFERENDRITFVGAAALTATALGAGIATFAVLQDRVQTLVRDDLQVALSRRADVFQEIIHSREVSARIAATRPAVLRNLRIVHAGNDDGSNVGNVRAVVDSFVAQGFSAIAYQDVDGKVVSSGGSFATDPSIAVTLATPEKAELLWSGGLILRHHIVLHDATGRVGALVAEQPLAMLTRLTQQAPGRGESWDMGLCSRRDRELLCFPQRLNPRAFSVPLVNLSGEPLPMVHALNGETGTVITRDYRAENVVAAYGPVGNLGLGMVLKVDTAEVFLPIRERLQVALWLLLAVVAAGTLLLRSQVRPIATRMQGALEERAAGLHRAQKVAKLAHVVTGPDGRFETWSETLPQLIGVEPASMPRDTRSWLNILHPEDRAKFRAAAIEAGIAGARREVGYRLRRTDGTWIDVQQTMEPLGGEAGADGKSRWFNTLQDVTDQKRAAGKIIRLTRVYAVLSGINSMIVKVRDRDELFGEACRIAFELGKFRLVYIGLVDHEAQCIKTVASAGDDLAFAQWDRPLRATDAGVRLGGAGRAVHSKQPVIFGDISANSSSMTYPEEALERGYRSSATFPLVIGDAAIGVFSLFAGETDFFDDEEVKLLEELTSDIAFAIEHLDLELRVRHRTAELGIALENVRTSELHYRMLFESNPHPMWVYDVVTLKFLAVNNAAVEQYGFAREEFLDMTILKIRPAEQEKTILDTVTTLGPSGPHKGIYRHSRKNGDTIDVEVVSDKLDFAGRPARIVLAHDITDRKRAEDEIQRLNAELEKRVEQRTAELKVANSELEAFSYSVSHDLRAPLRHVDGFAGMLREDYAPFLDETGQRYLGIITESVKQMGQLIDDLLLFSRMGRVDMHKEPVAMGELVNEVVNDLAGTIGERKIEWEIESLPSTRGDRAMLKQVWVNLLSNSIKYTRPRPVANIRIGYSKATGEFCVQDNGAGFEMAYADKLFGVFQRLHRAEEFEGTGVGLANVRRIINRHGGEIRALGEVDKGATFYFSLTIDHEAQS